MRIKGFFRVTRPVRLCVVIVAATVGVVLSVLEVKSILQDRRDNQCFLTWLGLREFGYALQCYLERNGHLPGPAFADVSHALSDTSYWWGHSSGDKLLSPASTILTGHDVWGRELRYELLNPSEAVVTCFGENGLEDQEGGDDIVIRVTRFGAIFGSQEDRR